MPVPTNTALPTNTKLIPLGKAARFFGELRDGRPVHPSTLSRWARKGVNGPSGRVFLAARRVGGTWAVTAEAIDEFIAALSALPGADAHAHEIRTPTQRQRSSQRAIEELKATGA